MEKKHIFTGTATALVTPMKEDGVDYEALGNLIDWQVASGVKALVVCATTGEACTARISSYSLKISLLTHRQYLPARKSVQILW